MTEYALHLSLNEVYKSLQERFFVQVPFPLERKVLEEVIQAFFRFLEEPDEVKSHIDFSIAPLHRRGDVGFKHREAKDHIYDDNKDFFHFHPAIFEYYQDFLEKNSVVQDFVLKAKPIWDLTYQVIGALLKTLEPDFPGIYNKVFKTKHPHIVLRFLKYEWHNSGKYLAKPHYDAGSFTLAIAESCPGLRIGSYQDNLVTVEHKPETAIFMVASNVKKIIKTDKLLPGWHDVIQLDETKIGKSFARWAIVAFIDGHGVEALSRSETHKWYDEKEAAVG